MNYYFKYDIISIMNLASNRRIYMDYEVLDTYTAGIALIGHEVKSARAGKIILEGSQIIVNAGLVQIVGMQISPEQPNNTPDTYKIDRTRDLLLKKGDYVLQMKYASKVGYVYTSGMSV